MLNGTRRVWFGMSYVRSIWSCLFASLAVITVAATPAAAQQQQKPNIFFIIADDIGWMQVQAYAMGLETAKHRT